MLDYIRGKLDLLRAHPDIETCVIVLTDALGDNDERVVIADVYQAHHQLARVLRHGLL